MGWMSVGTRHFGAQVSKWWSGFSSLTLLTFLVQQMEMLFCTTAVGLPFLIPPMLITGEFFRAWSNCFEVCHISCWSCELWNKWIYHFIHRWVCWEVKPVNAMMWLPVVLALKKLLSKEHVGWDSLIIGITSCISFQHSKMIFFVKAGTMRSILTQFLLISWPMQHPYVYLVLIFEAMATFIGQISVLSLIALFGAATTAMVSINQSGFSWLTELKGWYFFCNLRFKFYS